MNGNLSLGTIKIAWHATSGQRHEYLFEDVVYSPDSPFNILALCKLGDILGKQDTPSTSYDDGKCIILSANHSTLVWDHGQYQRTFENSSERLPELPLASKNSFFHSSCARLRAIYDDTCFHAFTVES